MNQTNFGKPEGCPIDQKILYHKSFHRYSKAKVPEAQKNMNVVIDECTLKGKITHTVKVKDEAHMQCLFGDPRPQKVLIFQEAGIVKTRAVSVILLHISEIYKKIKFYYSENNK